MFPEAEQTQRKYSQMSDRHIRYIFVTFLNILPILYIITASALFADEDRFIGLGNESDLGVDRYFEQVGSIEKGGPSYKINYQEYKDSLYISLNKNKAQLNLLEFPSINIMESRVFFNRDKNLWSISISYGNSIYCSKDTSKKSEITIIFYKNYTDYIKSTFENCDLKVARHARDELK